MYNKLFLNSIEMMGYKIMDVPQESLKLEKKALGLP